MTTNSGPAGSILQALSHDLEALGDALAGGRGADLLPIEIRLAADVDRLPECLAAARHAAGAPDGHLEIRSLSGRVAQALTRCRRLGGILEEVVQASLEAQGRTATYDRAGASTVDARSGALDARG
jgi:hypothetical protein